MISNRILELLKNPELLTKNDLPVIEDQIQKNPYIQSIRALQLLGIHQFDAENYNHKLSETAAYTTDKKILYLLINKEPISIEIPQKIENKISSNSIIEEQKTNPIRTSNFDVSNIIESDLIEASKPVYINGELNRILFEGEEDFLEKSPINIDLEATKESGILVTSEVAKEIVVGEEQEMVSNPENSTFTDEPKFEEIEEAETFSKEDFVNETELEKSETIKEPETIESAEISFHGYEDFLPEVQLKPNTTEENYQVATPKPNRHEEEMQRLIAEVEAKMKLSKKTKIEIPEEEPQHNFEINFAENFETLNKFPVSESVLENAESETIQTERPVINISFMSDEIPQVPVVDNANSNVPQFINTWKNWLKIDRVQQDDLPNEPEKVEVLKSKAIEKFIETEPKISQLKEEISFVVREKPNDVSHLMTETLANLYIEQKLYSKAIKAFETLKLKHPEKTGHFEEKINEIKDLKK